MPTKRPIPPPPSRRLPPPAQSREGVSWVSVLKQVGWPTEVLVLDFETYFDKEYGLRKMSTIEYIEDDRFEVLGLGLKWGFPQCPNQTSFALDVPDVLEHFQNLYGKHLEKKTVLCHNARFDGTILVRKYGIIPEYLVDVRDLSRHLNARDKHSVDEVCKRLGLPAKGDTMEFAGLHPSDMDKTKKEALERYTRNDVEIEFMAFERLLPLIANPEIELPLALHTHKLFWEPEFAFDFGRAEKLIAEMDAEIVEVCEGVGLPRKTVSGNLEFKRLLGESLAITNETVPMKQGKRGLIPAIAREDPAAKELLRHPTPRVRSLMKARRAVKSWPLHQARLRRMIAQTTAAGGLLANPLNYFGCHTGRFSGGERINTYNLPSRGGGLATQMKKCLMAQPGKTLVTADSAQIEARGVGWIAGEDKLVAAFAEGRDVYSEFAGGVLGKLVRKAREDDPPAVANLLEGRRAIGKVGILGMGYEMGPPRSLDYMMGYPQLALQVESGEIDLVFCQKFVKAYRETYSKIPEFWRAIETAVVIAVKYGEATTLLHGLRVTRDGPTILIQLPSGRYLRYPRCRLVDRDIKWQWGVLYGGILTENIVQAISRDVLAEALLRVEAAGYRVCHHLYDSLIVSVDQDQAEAALTCVCEELIRAPDWAEGWPLGVDATIGERY